jgi:hypothetical protein
MKTTIRRFFDKEGKQVPESEVEARAVRCVEQVYDSMGRLLSETDYRARGSA